MNHSGDHGVGGVDHAPAVLVKLLRMAPAPPPSRAADPGPKVAVRGDRVLVLDLECYYDADYSLKRHPIPEYVADRRFVAHGLAIRYPDGQTSFRADVGTAVAELQDSYGEQLEKAVVLMHNAQFDLFVLRHRFDLSVRNVVDTLLVARQVYGPRTEHGLSLGALAAAEGLGEKLDLEFMRGVRHPTPAQLRRLADYAARDVQLTYALFGRLRPRASNLAVELAIAAHTTRGFAERSVLVLSERLDEARELLLAQREAALAAAGLTAEQAVRDHAFTQLLANALAAGGREVPMKPGKRGPRPALARNDEAMQALAADNDPAVRALAQARLSVRSTATALARLDRLVQLTRSYGGRLHVQLAYHGAVTGRFAGTGGFNAQNMPSPARAATPGSREAAAALRRCFRADDGYNFVAVDACQIEARVLAWLAGEQDLVEAFAAGRDVYSEFAGEVFSREVRKPRDGDDESTRRELAALRGIGKEAILGLGFRMGALRFMQQLRAKAASRALFDDGVLTPAACHRIVQAYRGRYPAIPRLWDWCEVAFRASMTSGACAMQWVQGRLSFAHEPPVRVGTPAAVRMRLPSGRLIRYHRPALQASRPVEYLNEEGLVDVYEPKEPRLVWGHGKHPAYGGLLVENAVQAIARDVLVEAILRLEARGYPVVLHVHDEVVLHVPAERASDALAAALEELGRTPAWAPGLPLQGEGGTCTDLAKGA